MCILNSRFIKHHLNLLVMEINVCFVDEMIDK